MANEKVSSMTELNEVGSLDNKFLYVVTENEGGANVHNKMSLQTMQRGIMGGSNQGISNATFPQWEATCDLRISSNAPATPVLPCDCFVWDFWTPEGTKPTVEIENVIWGQSRG